MNKEELIVLHQLFARLRYYLTDEKIADTSIKSLPHYQKHDITSINTEVQREDIKGAINDLVKDINLALIYKSKHPEIKTGIPPNATEQVPLTDNTDLVPDGETETEGTKYEQIEEMDNDTAREQIHISTYE